MSFLIFTLTVKIHPPVLLMLFFSFSYFQAFMAAGCRRRQERKFYILEDAGGGGGGGGYWFLFVSINLFLGNIQSSLLCLCVHTEAEKLYSFFFISLMWSWVNVKHVRIFSGLYSLSLHVDNKHNETSAAGEVTLFKVLPACPCMKTRGKLKAIIPEQNMSQKGCDGA